MYKSQDVLINDLKEAFAKNENLPEKLVNATSGQEIKTLLLNNGIELDEEEADMMYTEYKKQMLNELDEESLDDVTGGSVGGGILIIAGGVAFAKGVYDSIKCKNKKKKNRK